MFDGIKIESVFLILHTVEIYINFTPAIEPYAIVELLRLRTTYPLRTKCILLLATNYSLVSRVASNKHGTVNNSWGIFNNSYAHKFLINCFTRNKIGVNIV